MDEDVPKWLIPDKAYDVLKWVGLCVCPAIAVCFGAVAPSWGLDAGTTNAVVLTINAVGTCIGAVIGASAAKNYISRKEGDGGDGEGIVKAA